MGRGPTAVVTLFLMRIRRKRVLTSFVPLFTISDFEKLQLTGEEDTKNGWVVHKPESAHLYGLQRVKSPYTKYLSELTAFKNNPKVVAAEYIMRLFPDNERMVFFGMSPTTAFILSLVGLDFFFYPIKPDHR